MQGDAWRRRMQALAGRILESGARSRLAAVVDTLTGSTRCKLAVMPPLEGARVRQLARLFEARTRQEFEAGLALAPFPDLAPYCEAVWARGTLRLRRFCLCCRRTTPMLLDLHASYDIADGRPVPNWRERLICGGCGLNNRQRLIAHLVQQEVAARASASIYLMEQVTPIHGWIRRLPKMTLQASEYLGPHVARGTSVRGVRHEDATALSFPGQAFDIIVSNDVMEHVPDPDQALRECFRVLKPGGTVLATFPFHATRKETVVRARVTTDGIEHLLPAEYHGNPLSPEGSLVFQDLGWDLMDRMADLGFCPACEVYASDEFGHLGTGLLVFRLRKPAGANMSVPA